MIKSLFGQSNYMSRALDASWLRNKVISNNIANNDTPNFKASTVRFEDILKDSINNQNIGMKRTNSKHMSANNTFDTIQPVVETDYSSTMRMDGNNVDMETQQANLAENTIDYYMMLHKLGKQFNRLKYAITEGK